MSDPAELPSGFAQAPQRPIVPPGDGVRRIIHIDMDAFYASVEQRDNPALRGRPVAVGGLRERGVVAAASYEARRFGVRSAMPSAQARRRCPDLIFVTPRFETYRAVSNHIRGIFARYTPLVEPLSLDEAYLDVTENLARLPTATATAREIRAAIAHETGLTASAGISYNKFIAKLASDQNKPNGQCVIPPERGPAFIAALPIGRFHGIGPATEARMLNLGIHTGRDLRDKPLDWLVRHFGKAGRWYFDISRGNDHRQVRPDRPRKSIGAETTYFTDITSDASARDAIGPLVDDVWTTVERSQVRGRTVTLKLRYTDFVTLTRSHSLPGYIASRAVFHDAALKLLEGLLPLTQGVRLLGVTLSSLDTQETESARQLEMDFAFE